MSVTPTWINHPVLFEATLRTADGECHEFGLDVRLCRTLMLLAARNASAAHPMPRGRQRLLSGTRGVVQVVAVRYRSARCRDLDADGIGDNKSTTI